MKTMKQSPASRDKLAHNNEPIAMRPYEPTGDAMQLVALGSELARHRMTNDFILYFLRENGISQGESQILIMKIKGISLREAKPIVLKSIVWEDSFDANLALQALVIKALRTNGTPRESN